MLQPVKTEDTTVPPLGPARAALADHLDALVGAQVETDRLLTPVHRLLARIESAEASLQAAEAERDTIAGKEAADLATNHVVLMSVVAHVSVAIWSKQ